MHFLALLLALADPAPRAPQSADIVTASGLRLETLERGAGRRPTPEDAVLVTYEGRLADGTLFDSASEPVGLKVSDLVPGFTEALLLMNEGGRYRVRIPARLAYGDKGLHGVIPPNAELIFTVALHDIGRPARPPATAGKP